MTSGADLPKTSMFRNPDLGALKEKIDYSQTRHPKIGGEGYEISIFCDKNGNRVLEKHEDEKGRVSYYYDGYDAEGHAAKVELHDFDGDGNFDTRVETYKNGRSITMRSSKDNGTYDTVYEKGKLIIDTRPKASFGERVKNFFNKFLESGIPAKS